MSRYRLMKVLDTSKYSLASQSGKETALKPVPESESTISPKA